MERKGQNVANLIAGLRDQAGLSNEQLAEAAGLMQGEVDGVVSGQIMCPDGDIMGKLALALPTTLGAIRSAAVEDGCTGAASLDRPEMMMADHIERARKDLAAARETIEKRSG